MKKTIVLLLIILLPTLLIAQNRPLVFRNVTVIDMRSEQPKPNMTVVVSGNRISKIGKNLKTPKDAQIVDASGKFLIPGLWDMHVHSLYEGRPEFFFPMFVANGVTGVREMGSPMPLDQINALRKSIESGEILAPRFGAVAGKILETPSEELGPEFEAVADADEGRRLVRERKAQGADFVKVYEHLPRDVYFAIADEARKQKIPFVGHIPFTVSAVEAADAGQKSIEHLTGMFVACSAKEDRFKNLKEQEFTRALFNEMIDSFSEQKCREVSAAFVRNGTAHCPTLSIMRVFASADDENLVNDERLKYIPLSARQKWQISLSMNLKAGLPIWKKIFPNGMELVKLLKESHVMLLAGTDVGLGNAYTFAGFSLHDELALLVKAGLTPFEALQTATINPARFLGKEKDSGTIGKGKLADLVLLDANPLTDITNTKKINAIVLNGHLLDRKTLDKMLAEVEAEAKTK